MTDRASVFETTQIGVETTPGTAVAALKKLLSTGIRMTLKSPAKMVKPQGSKAAVGAVKLKEWSEGTIEGDLSYNDIIYLLAGLFGAPTITTPDGGTNARCHTFIPNTFQPDDPKTFTVEKGGRAGAERAVNVVVNGLQFSFSLEEVGISGDVFGKELVSGIQLSTNEQQTITIDADGGTFTISFGGQTTSALAWNAAGSEVQTALEALSTIGTGNIAVTKDALVYTLEFRNDLGQKDVAQVTTGVASLTKGAGAGTATPATTVPGVAPTELPCVPVSPCNVSVYVAAAEANLGDPGTKLLNLDEVSLGISDRFTRRATIDAAEPSFKSAVEKAFTWAANINVGKDDQSATLLTNLQQAETRWCKIECIEDELIEAGQPYQMNIIFPFKFTDVTDAEKDDVETSNFPLEPIHDTTLGGCIKFEVYNGLASL